MLALYLISRARSTDLLELVPLGENSMVQKGFK